MTHNTAQPTSHLSAFFLILIAIVGCTFGDLFASDQPEQSQSALQEMLDAATPGEEIILRAGFYELGTPLRIRHSISLRAADGAKVVLSGGRKLELQWTPHTAGVFQARIPAEIDLATVAFDQLYLDGHRLHVARYPNYEASQRFFGGTSADSLSPTRIATWRNPTGGIIHSLHRSEWGGNHWRITGKNYDGTLALEGGWMNNRPSGINPQRRFVENIHKELDAPGEWFLNRGARTLFVYPPAGATMQTAEVVVSAIDRLLEFVGETPDSPATGLRIEGVTFAHTARTFMKTDEPLLRSDWMIHRGGAIYLENVRDVEIEDCVFQGLGGNGVFVSGHAENVAVRGTHFTDLGASGVCFVGRPEAVRSPSFNYSQAVPLDQLDREPGPKTEDYPRDCVVENCLMHDLGTVEKQVAGVQISMAARITVRHVSIYDVPRAGINISEGTWGGHLIEWCDVFDTVQMTGDHGSFNSWGRDRFWHPNRGVLDRLTSKRPELILLDAIETSIIRNSRWRCDHGWDIDLDDGSSNYELYNNLCLHGGIKLREGFHRRVSNNIMVNNSFHPHVWFKESHDVFERNIVMSWYRPIRLAAWGDKVDFNLLPDVASLDRSHALGLDANSVAGAPMFVDPAHGDFRVADNSPALSIGFKNFPMDRFGVQKTSLRSIARTPVIPVLGVEATSDDFRPGVFLGASVKRLHGLGERSATGMDAERGVLVLSVPDGSAAHTAGMQANDVILRVGGVETNHPSQLQTSYLRTGSGDRCDFVLFRNQREQVLQVDGVLAIRLTGANVRMVGDGQAPVYDAAKDFVGSWTNPSAALEWSVECRGPVTFDVYAEIAGTEDAQGATWSFTIGDDTLEGTTPNTGGWETFKRTRLGQVSFERYGDVQARLTPLRMPKFAIMNFRAVDLILAPSR